MSYKEKDNPEDSRKVIKVGSRKSEVCHNN